MLHPPILSSEIGLQARLRMSDEGHHPASDSYQAGQVEFQFLGVAAYPQGNVSLAAERIGGVMEKFVTQQELDLLEATIAETLAKKEDLEKLATKEDLHALELKVMDKLAEVQADVRSQLTVFRIEVNGQLTGFKEELAGFKEELAGFKEELAGFKEELAGFKEELAGFKKELTNFRQEFSEQLASIRQEIRNLGNSKAN